MWTQFGAAEDNILGTYNVLEAVRKSSRGTRIVFASSACFYGVPVAEPPLTETDAPAVGHYILYRDKNCCGFCCTALSEDLLARLYLRANG
ncbi:MAG: GDP-mannose 4,6-dehydratase [Acidobacteria bacterium]|nr:GDP-mannose 4,6-dehydratase [Acidobacteriota bacterium]